MELGYSFTSGLEECRNALASLGAREITPGCVARVLSHMARSCSGLDDAGGLQTFWGATGTSPDLTKDKSADGSSTNTWNVEIFVQALKEVVSFAFKIITKK